MFRSFVAAAALLVLAGCGQSATVSGQPPLETVKSVDLTRYLGVWHEMARYENEFQGPECVNVTAEYGLDEDGDISVLNTCRNEARAVTETAKGWARVADRQTNAKLRVTFFWPFFGDYWVVALADDYSWVIVSEPRREYLWILTRQPVKDGALKDELVAKAAALGFDAGKLYFSQR